MTTSSLVETMNDPEVIARRQKTLALMEAAG